MVTTSSDIQRTTITLSPNRSLDWAEIRPWLYLLSLPALIVGIAWFIAGVWIILPFAGLELGLLAFFMYRTCYQNYRQQQIIIDKNEVIVEMGIHKSKRIFHCERLNCYLYVKFPNKPIDNLELKLTCESLALVIGEFLNPADRELARYSLTKAGLIECSSHWWKGN